MKTKELRLLDVRKCAELLRQDASGAKACNFLEKTNGTYTEDQKETLFQVAEDLIYRSHEGRLVRQYILGELSTNLQGKQELDA